MFVNFRPTFIEVDSFNEDLHIWEPLIELSRTSKHKFKHSCALVNSKGKILSAAINSLKTHPVLGSKPPYLTLHSEGNAIYGCLKNNIKTFGLVAYVCRVDQYRRPINSKPCKSCLKLFTDFGISKVYYTVTP